MVRNPSVERSSLEWIGRGKRVEGEAQDTEQDGLFAIQQKPFIHDFLLISKSG